MSARQVKNEIMYEEWEFDTQEEMDEAIKKEAHVCGDSIEGNTLRNYHKGGVRWRGMVTLA